jgi:hypothetical protein
MKSEFLRFSFFYDSNALYLLATKVKEGAITAQEWAAAFGVAGT